MNQIWLSGSSGTGKSTTGRILAKKLGLELIDGVSRGSKFDMHTLEHQQYMSNTIFGLRGKNNFVSCRSPLDVLAYSVAFNINNMAMDSLHSFLFAKSNPTIIYFPYGHLNIEDDGFRPISPVLNRQVDSEIKKQLDYYKVEYYEVKKESANSRANSIIKYLEEL